MIETGEIARTAVDRYWSEHTVNSEPFASAEESERYLDWRFAEYPLFQKFMDLWGDHEGETVLDYGCGPGDDLVGFVLHSGAARVIGIDVSEKALDLARRRLDLHGVDGVVELVQVSDGRVEVPLADRTVDYVHCAGVLQHTSRPESILRELRRVLRPEGRAMVMVYNRDSVYFHLYTAYVRTIVEGAFTGLHAEEAFARNTDGPDCPVSRCFRPPELLRLCEEAGFQAEFVGGYFARIELELLARFGGRARRSIRLGSEHRRFLRALKHDRAGRPLYRGKHAGVGGVYRLW